MDKTNMNELSEPLAFGRSFTWRKPIVRKAALYFAALFIIVIVLSLILVSPLLLRQIAHIRGIDWAGLSNVGQTYGAASAILSAVALIGITLSLLIQARQARTERVRITRERHMELLRVMLDAPDVYGPVIGLQAQSKIDYKRFIFSTMWVNYARVGFQMGILSEEILRDDLFGPSFEYEPMRNWWTDVRKYWTIDTKDDRKERRLVQIIDEEYRKAVKAGPPSVLNVEEAAPSVLTAAGAKRHDMLAGAAVGVAIGIMLRSRLWPNRR